MIKNQTDNKKAGVQVFWQRILDSILILFAMRP